MSEASKGGGAAWDPPGLWGPPSRSPLSFWGSSRPSLCFEGGYGPGGARGALCVRKRGLGGRGFPGPAGMEEGEGHGGSQETWGRGLRGSQGVIRGSVVVNGLWRRLGGYLGTWKRVSGDMDEEAVGLGGCLGVTGDCLVVNVLWRGLWSFGDCSEGVWGQHLVCTDGRHLCGWRCCHLFSVYLERGS